MLSLNVCIGNLHVLKNNYMDSIFEIETAVDVPSHSLWVEKYRPKIMDDFLGSSAIKEKIKSYVASKEIPHILFYGPPGTGKTSLARLLINNIPCDSLTINASDENGVNDMRTKVQDFVMTMGVQPLKILFLEESDRLTPDAQGLLRPLFEEYSDHTRFILTCNYHGKIVSAIQSRCQCFEIKPPSKSECAGHLAKILTAEGVTYTPKDVVFIINSYFPDMRKIINFAQQSTNDNNVLALSTENVMESDYKMKLVELLKTSNREDAFDDIRQLIAEAAFSNYEEVYKFLYSTVSDYAPRKEAVVIAIIAEYLYQSALVYEREITFCAAMSKIVRTLNTI